MNIAGIIATPDKIPAGDSNVLPPNLITFGRNGEFILEFQNINAIQKTITVNTAVLYHGLKFLFPFLNMNFAQRLMKDSTDSAKRKLYEKQRELS